MAYFNPFPYINYQFPDDIVRLYKNVSVRPAIVDKLLASPANLESYTIGEGETPDTIAYDIYNNTDYHWVILLANNILNFYKDWPKDYKQFESFVQDKYRTQYDSDGTEVVLTDIQVQEFVEFAGSTSNNYQSHIELGNGHYVRMRPHHFEDADGNEYSYHSASNTRDAFGRTTTSIELFPISIYEYENKLNESKRDIVLPTKKLAERMQSELTGLVNEQ